MINPRTSFVVPRTRPRSAPRRSARSGGTLPGLAAVTSLEPRSWSQVLAGKCASALPVGGGLGTAKEVLGTTKEVLGELLGTTRKY